MNFSTTSEKTSNITIQGLSHDELYEQFMILKTQFDNLAKQYENTQQELYNAKKCNQFAIELKEHFASEVDACQKNEVKLKQDYSLKIQYLNEEIETLKEEKWNETESLKSKIETLQSKIMILEKSSDETSDEKSVCQIDNTKINEELRQFEEENTFLKNLINEQKREMKETTHINEEMKNKINNLEEQVECLKCNLDSKKEELLSLTDMLHSAQDDLCGANIELQRFKSDVNTHAVKGNSLFAEVDDKRQEMLKTLSQMKDKVHQLNREVINKQAEIDSLLCEKKTLWDEYAGQTNHHNANLNRAYERRITDLEKQNDELHREIARWYDNNLDPSSTELTKWVSGVLDYYREENHRLNNEFAANSVDNLFKEQKLRDLHRQLVTWRTKATEANATIYQLESKMQNKDKHSASINVHQSRNHHTSIINDDLRTKDNEVKIFKEIDNNEKENFSPRDNINEKENLKDSINKPGILVTGGVKSKSVKKTTFQ